MQSRLCILAIPSKKMWEHVSPIAECFSQQNVHIHFFQSAFPTSHSHPQSSRPEEVSFPSSYPVFFIIIALSWDIVTDRNIFPAQWRKFFKCSSISSTWKIHLELSQFKFSEQQILRWVSSALGRKDGTYYPFYTQSPSCPGREHWPKAISWLHYLQLVLF